MCQIEKFGASPFRYVRTDIEVHGEERVLTVHNRAAIPIITKRFACYDTPSFYSPVRKEPRDKKQKNRKIQDKQGQAHDRAPKKRSQERESETKPKQKKRGDYRHSYSYSYSSTLPDFSDTSCEMSPNRQKKTPQQKIAGFSFFKSLKRLKVSHKFQDDLVVFGNFGHDTLVVKIHLIVEPDIGHKRQSEAERNTCRDAMTLQIID